MGEEKIRGILGKVSVEGKLKLLSGMHIGGSKAFSAIGAVDSPVIRNSFNKEPYIPGSSIKGKMRYLLARVYAGDGFMKSIDREEKEIKRLFGSSAKNDIIISRLQFSDLNLSEESKIQMEKFSTDLYLTEVKYENTIYRLTAEANPRQLERVPAGAEFDFRLIYNIEEEQTLKEDMKNIGKMFSLLEDDYLGGSGTRGYGRVTFEDLGINTKLYNDKKNELLEIVTSSFTEGREGTV